MLYAAWWFLFITFLQASPLSDETKTKLKGKVGNLVNEATFVSDCPLLDISGTPTTITVVQSRWTKNEFVFNVLCVLTLYKVVITQLNIFLSLFFFFEKQCRA